MPLIQAIHILFVKHTTSIYSNCLLKVLGILEFLLKLQKTTFNKLEKTTWQFRKLGKIFASLGKYVKSSIAWHHVYPNLPTCWRLNFVILAKILGCQVLLPSPNSKLLEKTFFFTWHLVLRLGKTIDLSSEF